MAVNTESICDILVKDTADIAGTADVASGELLVSATDDDSNIDRIADSGHDVLANVYRDDVKNINDCMEAAADAVSPQGTTSRVQLSADEWCLFEFTIYPRGHFADEPDAVFTGRNVTDEHFANQRRKVINRVLRHNLRNEMEVILGNAKIAREHCESGAESPLDEIDATARRLLSLGEKIREVDTRLNDSNYRFRRVNLREVVDRAVETYHAAHPGVTFTVNVGDHVIAGNSLVGDAVEEVVENAIRHCETPPDELVVSITTEEIDSSNEIRLTVADNGIGIPQGEAAAISEATESQLTHGSGVGLWLVKWITDSIHATFEIGPRESTRGTAAVFGFKNADRMDEREAEQLAGLNQREIIRTELPEPGSSEIATSTRG